MQWKTILLALLMLSFSAQADECSLGGYGDFDYRTALEVMTSSTCFQLENNRSPLGGEVRRVLAAADQDALSQAEQAALALEAILASLGDAAVSDNAVMSANAQALQAAISALQQSIIANPATPPAGIKADWQLSSLAAIPAALDALDMSSVLTAAECEQVSSGNCDSEFAMAADMVRSIYLANAELDKYTEVYRGNVFEDRRLRRAKWDSYYDDLTFQYPWELWANSLILERTDKRRKSDGNRLGFRSLPRSKLVLLHPEANLVYADEAENEYDISLSMELVGFERFGFDRQGKVNNPWGLSLLAAYLPHPERNEFGWSGGLLVKYDGYSLGVTDNHGETGIVFNINLSQRIFSVKQEARRYYDEYETRLEQIRQSFEDLEAEVAR